MIRGKFQAQNFSKGPKGIIAPAEDVTLLDLARLDGIEVVVIPASEFSSESKTYSPNLHEQVKLAKTMLDDILEVLK